MRALSLAAVALSATILMVVCQSFAYQIELIYGYGAVSGYMQTPLGGTPGTATPKRPTLEELGIEETTFTGISIQKGLAEPTRRLYMWLISIDMAQSGILGSSFTMRKEFNAGEPYRVHTAYRLSAVGVERDYRERLTLRLELFFMDFGTTLRTPQRVVKRGYIKPAIRAGMGLRLPWLPAELMAMATAPLSSSSPSLFTVELSTEAALTHSLTAGMAVDYLLLDYEDDQTLPNHLRLELGPALRLFVGYSF